jgi:hypothetical protein
MGAEYMKPIYGGRIYVGCRALLPHLSTSHISFSLTLTLRLRVVAELVPWNRGA